MFEEGLAFIHLRRARLCCEESCEAVFDLAGIADPGGARCPACGGDSWIPLTKIVEPIGLAAVTRVPALKAIEGRP